MCTSKRILLEALFGTSLSTVGQGHSYPVWSLVPLGGIRRRTQGPLIELLSRTVGGAQKAAAAGREELLTELSLEGRKATSIDGRGLSLSVPISLFLERSFPPERPEQSLSQGLRYTFIPDSKSWDLA